MRQQNAGSCSTTTDGVTLEKGVEKGFVILVGSSDYSVKTQDFLACLIAHLHTGYGLSVFARDVCCESHDDKPSRELTLSHLAQRLVLGARLRDKFDSDIKSLGLDIPLGPLNSEQRGLIKSAYFFARVSSFAGLNPTTERGSVPQDNLFMQIGKEAVRFATQMSFCPAYNRMTRLLDDAKAYLESYHIDIRGSSRMERTAHMGKKIHQVVRCGKPIVVRMQSLLLPGVRQQLLDLGVTPLCVNLDDSLTSDESLPSWDFALNVDVQSVTVVALAEQVVSLLESGMSDACVSSEKSDTKEDLKSGSGEETGLGSALASSMVVCSLATSKSGLDDKSVSVDQAPLGPKQV